MVSFPDAKDVIIMMDKLEMIPFPHAKDVIIMDRLEMVSFPYANDIIIVK